MKNKRLNPSRIMRLAEADQDPEPETRSLSALSSSSFAPHVQDFLRASRGKTGATWEAVLVVEGWSLNNRYYTREAVEQMKKLVDGMPNGKIPIRAFAFGDFDHLPADMQDTMPGPAGNVVGAAGNTKLMVVDGKTALVATIDIFENAEWLRKMLRSAFKSGAMGMLGLSLDGQGAVREGEAEGRRGWIVDAVTSLSSFDVVTHPAAGGEFTKLVASQKKGDMKAMNEHLKRLLAAIAHVLGVELQGAPRGMVEAVLQNPRVVAGSALQAGLNAIADLLTGDAEDPAVTEAIEAEIGRLGVDVVTLGIAPIQASEDDGDGDGEDGDGEDGDGEDGAGVSEAILSQIADLQRRLEQAERASAQRQTADEIAASRAIQRAVVEGTGLPQNVRDHLLALMDGQVLTESQVRATVRDHREYLGTLVDDGHVVDLGENTRESQITESANQVRKHQMSLELAMGLNTGRLSESEQGAYRDVAAATSLRKLYTWFTGDENVDGVVDHAKAFGGLGTRRIGEAISTSTFTYALGTSANKIMQQEYRAYQSDYRQFTEVIRAENFKKHELIQWGTLGDVAAVLDGATYNELTVPSDFEAYFTPAKYGGKVSITRETIINDDMRFLARVPRMVGRAASRVHEQFVYDLLLNVSGGVINAGTGAPDGTAVYSAAHGNLVVDSVDSDSIEAAQQALWNQTDSGQASEILGLSPGYAVIPRELRPIVQQVQNSERVVGSAENQINTLQGSMEGIIVSSKMRSSTTAMVLTGRKSEIDMLTMGYINGQEEPTIILQNNEAVGTVFTHDKIAYKVRHEYGGVMNDHRGVVMIKPA